MFRNSIKPIGLALLLSTAIACSSPPTPPIQIHYLGHASFLLEFDNGTTVLTDYGDSNAYGLDSPVYGLGTVVPDVVTLSHDHADHAGGELPEGIRVSLTGNEGFEQDGLTITAIPTHERSLDSTDNTSYLFEYRGLKVLHLGDCQALILAASDSTTADRVAALYPDNYDVVMVPIGYMHDILAEAAEFTTYINARKIIPMHYWSPPDRDTFIEMMGTKRDRNDRPYISTVVQSARFFLEEDIDLTDSVAVVGLLPSSAEPESD